MQRNLTQQDRVAAQGSEAQDRKCLFAGNRGLLGLVLCTGMLLGTGAVVAKQNCATIKDGIYDGQGNLLVKGFDDWGYNYRGHVFNGLFGNMSRPATPVTEDDTRLVMKWNDAWLSSTDCDLDGLLDRHRGYPSYIGSGAWLTNHQRGSYEADGQTYKWNYFVKVAAVPADAVLDGGIWYASGGVEIGPAIWGEFAIIQEVYNDQGSGEHGLHYKSPSQPGLGAYKH